MGLSYDLERSLLILNRKRIKEQRARYVSTENWHFLTYHKNWQK